MAQSSAPIVRDDPRMAGCVLRYHTWPHVRSQSNAEHSWQVARLLLAIWPDAPRNVIVYCLTHDVGEVGTGDAPFPIKRDNPDLKKIMDRIEKSTHLGMCIPWNLPHPGALSALEAIVFKIADMLDMWEWGLQEIMLGNRFADLAVQRTQVWLAERATDPVLLLPDQDQEQWSLIRQRLQDYMVRRTKTWPHAAEFSKG